MSALLFDDLAYSLVPTRAGKPAHGAIAPMGQAAVMAGRVESADSLDFFPTPPWVARQFCAEIMPELWWHDAAPPLAFQSVWEPAAGAGHMAQGLHDAGFGAVHASDIAAYEWGCPDVVSPLASGRIGDFVDGSLAVPDGGVDWIITNPPFVKGIEFAARALTIARRGVALFVRLAWAETIGRYHLHQAYSPSALVSFADRVPLFRGRWDPNGASATAYCWVVWTRPDEGRSWGGPTKRRAWLDVSPGARGRFELPHDRDRWGREFLVLNEIDGVAA